jgi:hypothetical protein
MADSVVVMSQHSTILKTTSLIFNLNDAHHIFFGLPIYKLLNHEQKVIAIHSLLQTICKSTKVDG